MTTPWTNESLLELYSRGLAFDQTRGLDRLSPVAMKTTLDLHMSIIAKKVPSGSYQFGPYLQILRPKGARKPPREISIPSARDRLVLLQLKERLHGALPEAVRRDLPNTVVRDALVALQAADALSDVCLRIDIKDFYPSIGHDSLLQKLPATLTMEEKHLVHRAIRNPSVPAASRRTSVPRLRQKKGVPQGLAISNVLADLYLHDLDVEMRGITKAYFRFVDDILIITSRDAHELVFGALQRHMTLLGLNVHPLAPRSPKGGVFALDEPIEFLGYVFDQQHITVRDPSVDRFLEKIAARVARFRRERPRLLREVKWMTEALVDAIFIEELND